MKNKKIKVIVGDVLVIGEHQFIIIQSKNKTGPMFYLKKLRKICPKCNQMIK